MLCMDNTKDKNNNNPVISVHTATPLLREPPFGSWAYVARIMADIEPDFDWDSWKDEMKERDNG